MKNKKYICYELAAWPRRKKGKKNLAKRIMADQLYGNGSASKKSYLFCPAAKRGGAGPARVGPAGRALRRGRALQHDGVNF